MDKMVFWDTNYMHSSFLSKVLLITEDEDVNDMTSCMTLKTMIIELN